MKNYKKGISTLTLKKDIKRGVKHINEESYNKYHGITTFSVNFIQYVLNECNVGNVSKVEFTKSYKNHYTVKFYTDLGYTIVGKGLSFGYFGEGSRASREILHQLGFSDRQCNKVFKKSDKSFKVLKRIS